MGKNNNGFCPRTYTRENLLFIQQQMSMRFYTCVPEETGFASRWSCSLSSPRAFSSVSFLSLPLFPIPFPMLPPFLIYLYLHHIFTIHFYLASLLFWHLLPFTSETGGGRDLFSCDLYCLGHFLINAADKAIVYHLMWMQQATSGQKLPYCLLTTTLFRF